MKRLNLFVALIALAAGFGVAACSGPTPPSPVVVTPPVVDPGPVVNNTPPVVGAFTVQGTRTKEPANFADVSESVPVTVQVTDSESNPNDLKYNWSATLGTFSGTGRSVTWKAPAIVDGPTEVTLNLEVVETYTSQGKSIDNKPTGSVKLWLHDSIKEVGDMSRQFLLDFSDSSIPTATVMRNFGTDASCYGTEAETSDVAKNRTDFEIKTWTVDPPTTSVNFGGSCPIPTRNPAPGDACSRVHTDWHSVARRDLDGLAKGESSDAHGVDYIAALYYPSPQNKWKLCDSQYIGDASMSLRARLLPSLVP